MSLLSSCLCKFIPMIEPDAIRDGLLGGEFFLQVYRQALLQDTAAPLPATGAA